MTQKIIFRTLGGMRIGYGHYYRCISLASACYKSFKRIEITFIVNKELEELIKETHFKYFIKDILDEDIEVIQKKGPDLFVFDSYLGNDHYLRKVKDLTKLMIFDDNNDIYDSTIPDILLNGNIYANHLNYKLNKNSLYLLGPKYLVLKEEYWETNKEIEVYKDGLLITTGGTDLHEISYIILKNINELPIKKRVIIGPSYSSSLIKKIEELNDTYLELIYKPKSLKDYIRTSKLVITASGSTVYEVLTQKTMPLIFSMAKNQEIAYYYFEAHKIPVLGKYPNINYDIIQNKIKKIINDNEDLHWNKIYNYFKSDGVKQVIEAIQECIRGCD
ncbi:hypothetical protein RH915_09765 [Serpentinicella sp. ANB-PHB4]|uniref:hypothetical protein n=1 Tax=Serpentinicella sp. ANB-PHB4 TaxID=3074076 RepID=UPI00285CB934|nr:hypothetical protein [Serpentinicella sp. ANB-PHB4]MDR5659783.1 hypothetical protein [Serpentinicella sp. ANB-PHB4]